MKPKIIEMETGHGNGDGKCCSSEDRCIRMALHAIRAITFVLISITFVFTVLKIMKIEHFTHEPVIYLTQETKTLQVSTAKPGPPRSELNQTVVDLMHAISVDTVPVPYTLNTSKCSIPIFDPYDPTTAKYFKGSLKSCSKQEKPLLFSTNVTPDGRTCPVFNETTAKIHYPKLNFTSMECEYREAYRSNMTRHPDTKFLLKRYVQFKIGDCPPEENIWMECTVNGTVIEQPLLLPKARPIRSRKAKKNAPFNVVVLGIDALSRLNFIRLLHKTRRWLERHCGAVEMFGYNKIAENSAPNQIPMMTGMSYIPGLMDRAIGNYFDNLTEYIWDHYKKHGYTTMFFEEQWWTGLFVHPSMKGFYNIPTDYWPRPLMQCIDGSALKKLGNGLCIGGEYAQKLYLKYLEDALQIARRSNPLFAYAWFSELSHDFLNGAGRADKDFSEFFERIFENGLLDESVILFLADHGSRIEEWRATVVGRYEDMLPFFYVLVPPRLAAMKPDLVEKLRVNSRRLVTVYDIYATLLELADPSAGGRKTKGDLGVSLLSYEVPESRTCLQAGINLQFCACLRPVRMDSKSPLARKFGDFVIDTVNEELDRNNVTTLCVRWKFDKVQNIFELEDPDREFQIYKILLQASPHKAWFEAAAIYKDGKFTLQSRIERLDWYSVNANCVRDKHFARYCYCK